MMFMPAFLRAYYLIPIEQLMCKTVIEDIGAVLE